MPRPPHSPAVLLDSFSDLDFVQAEEIGADLLIQMVEFGGEILLDSNDLPYAELFRQLDRGAAPPKATALSVSAYYNTLERMLARAPHVIAVHPALSLSNGLDAARTAALAFAGRVSVIGGGVPETGAAAEQPLLGAATVSVGLALQAAWARRQFALGRGGAEVGADLEQLRLAQRTLLYAPTLRYLHTPMGTLWREQFGLDVAAMISGPGGDAKLVGMPLSPTLGLRMMQQYLQRYARAYPAAEVAFFHTDAPEAIASLSEYAQRAGLTVRWAVPSGLLLASQLGWGSYGFSILPNEAPADLRQTLA